LGFNSKYFRHEQDISSSGYFPFFLGICLAGCNKQLDKLPDNRTVITNVDQVTQLLTSAYPHAVYMAFTEPNER